MTKGNKSNEILRTLDKWMTERECNHSLGLHLKNQGIKNVGIYGYGVLGRHLLYELEEAHIQIGWIMDKRTLQVPYPLCHINDGERILQVDLIIVTAICNFKEIEGQLRFKTCSPIISLREIVDEMLVFRLWETEKKNANEIANYLAERGLNKIGIYGHGVLGKLLLTELMEKGIVVAWIIDKVEEEDLSSELQMDFEVDAIINTVISNFDEVEKQLCSRSSVPLISLQEIVEEMKYWRERQ